MYVGLFFGVDPWVRGSMPTSKSHVQCVAWMWPKETSVKENHLRLPMQSRWRLTVTWLLYLSTSCGGFFFSPVVPGMDAPNWLEHAQRHATGGAVHKWGCYRFACGCDIRKWIATRDKKYYSNNEQHGRLVYMNVRYRYVKYHFSGTV